jgi:chromosome segregation ATPase
MTSEDYSTLSPKQKELREKVAKDKGDRILIISAQLKELEDALPARIEERERLEAEITRLNTEIEDLNHKWKVSNGRLTDAEITFAQIKKKTDTLLETEKKLKHSINDYDQKILERNKIAEEIKILQEEESNLSGSISLKETELRVLSVKVNSIKEREDSLSKREREAERKEKNAEYQLSEATRKLEETSKINKEMSEHRRVIDLSGKTMGHYIRGVQKYFDENSIKIDFIKLLDTLNK